MGVDRRGRHRLQLLNKERVRSARVHRADYRNAANAGASEGDFESVEMDEDQRSNTELVALLQSSPCAAKETCSAPDLSCIGVPFRCSRALGILPDFRFPLP